MDIYTVWRRSDGYVGATAGRIPSTFKTATGIAMAFDELFVTDDWPAAHARIRAERVADEMLAQWRNYYTGSIPQFEVLDDGRLHVVADGYTYL